MTVVGHNIEVMANNIMVEVGNNIRVRFRVVPVKVGKSNSVRAGNMAPGRGCRLSRSMIISGVGTRPFEELGKQG